MQAQISPDLFFSQTTSIFENSRLGPLNWNIHHWPCKVGRDEKSLKNTGLENTLIFGEK